MSVNFIRKFVRITLFAANINFLMLILIMKCRYNIIEILLFKYRNIIL